MTRLARPPRSAERSRTARPRKLFGLGRFGTSAFHRYLRQSEQPLAILLFLLPPLVIFEIGITYHSAEPVAMLLLHLLFSWLGAPGRFIPALSVVGILLAWHMIRQDPWVVRWETLVGMAIESWALALPLLLFDLAIARLRVPLYSATDAWRDETILSLGAGIYEELIFRLILISLLSVLLVNFLRWKPLAANLVIVFSTAILFALYHYLGSETFNLQSFAFRTIAGIYFGAMFLTRGFGITAGCHISYDCIIIACRWGALH